MGAYFQLPKFIFKDNYKELSINAKVMYTLLLDRYKSSIRLYRSGNKMFYDEEYDNCFVYFSNKEFKKYLSIVSNNVLVNVKNELVEAGLIRIEFTDNNNIKYFIHTVEEAELTSVVEIDKETNSIILKDNKVDEESLKNKWKVKRDCDVCQRLFMLFKNDIEAEHITDKEFWYIRNYIQDYEYKGKNIINFRSFVKNARKRYEENIDFIKVDVGGLTEADNSKYINSILSKPKNNKSDDILNFDWLND